MKKMLLSILISVVSATMLMGCTSDTEMVVNDSVSSEATVNVSEENSVVSETIIISEEASVEEVVIIICIS